MTQDPHGYTHPRWIVRRKFTGTYGGHRGNVTMTSRMPTEKAALAEAVEFFGVPASQLEVVSYGDALPR